MTRCAWDAAERSAIIRMRFNEWPDNRPLNAFDLEQAVAFGLSPYRIAAIRVRAGLVRSKAASQPMSDEALHRQDCVRGTRMLVEAIHALCERQRLA